MQTHSYMYTYKHMPKHTHIYLHYPMHTCLFIIRYPIFACMCLHTHIHAATRTPLCYTDPNTHIWWVPNLPHVGRWKWEHQQRIQ